MASKINELLTAVPANQEARDAGNKAAPALKAIAEKPQQIQARVSEMKESVKEQSGNRSDSLPKPPAPNQTGRGM